MSEGKKRKTGEGIHRKNIFGERAFKGKKERIGKEEQGKRERGKKRTLRSFRRAENKKKSSAAGGEACNGTEKKGHRKPVSGGGEGEVSRGGHKKKKVPIVHVAWTM